MPSARDKLKSLLDRYLLIFLALVLAISIATKAVAKSTQVRSHYPIQLIERAEQLYRAEQYVKAGRVWQEAVTAFEQQSDILNQAMALSNLALTQQKLGNLTAAETAIASSLELLQTHSSTAPQQRILANSLDVRGSIERSRGEFKLAVETWQRAETIYRELNENKAIITNQINQAQALQDIGYYRRAGKILRLVQTDLSEKPDSTEKVSALISLGNTLRAVGNLEGSQGSLEVLQQALKIAEINAGEQKNAVLLSLGNTLRALGNRDEQSQTTQQADLYSSQCLTDNNLESLENAATHYRQAADFYRRSALSSNLETKNKAQLNLLSLLVQNQTLLNRHFPSPTSRSWSKKTISHLIANIETNLTHLPVTRTTVYDRLNLVQSLIYLQPNTVEFASPIVQQCQSSSKDLKVSWANIESEVKIALEQANQLQDKPAVAYASGYLGAVYQQTEKLTLAQQLTEQALLSIDSNAIDNTAAPEITYLWQWQLGRIYQLQNNVEAALQAYDSAFDSLQSLKSNLVAVNPEMQFAFRNQIEPLYRERVTLLLSDLKPSQENLIQARDTIEALQLAQLNNFFREACLDAPPQKIEQLDPTAAIIYSIILRDRLAVILSQPQQPLKYEQTTIEPQVIDRALENLYATFSRISLTKSKSLQPNQIFYNWLVRPFENELAPNQTNTLVFILDGIMRGIPVSALHDGKQYLIEKYGLALTPGLQLLTSRPLTSDTLETIAGGLTESRQGFGSLPNVELEVSEIADLVPSEILLDKNFTRDRLREKITTLSYPVVHLATHGQFSSRAEDTFLLTWDDRINVKYLDRLLQDRDFTEDTPIELLILSACQTATGDKQAPLGLAGVAVRSGARSTLATLWRIEDNSAAELMIEFYRAIKKPGTTKAEALRQAQLSLLRSPKYQHPYYWSAFVLVGNWL